MVYTYSDIGRYIIEYEQEGNYRASYGKGVLNRLSAKLTDRFGKGWSYETLAKCRKFYHAYAILSDSQTKCSNTEIYASAYEQCLPSKALLQNKLQEWVAEFEENKEDKAI